MNTHSKIYWIFSCLMNETICVHILLTTFAHLIIQVVNNSLVGEWTALDIVCVITSCLNATDGLYKLLYCKLCRGKRIADLPVATSCLGLMFYNFDKVQWPDMQPGQADIDSEATNDVIQDNSRGADLKRPLINVAALRVDNNFDCDYAYDSKSNVELEPLQQRLATAEQRLATAEQRLFVYDQRFAVSEQRLGVAEQRVEVPIRSLAEAKEDFNRRISRIEQIMLEKLGVK